MILGEEWGAKIHGCFFSRDSGTPKLMPRYMLKHKLEARRLVDFNILMSEHSLLPLVERYEANKETNSHTLKNETTLRLLSRRMRCESCELYDVNRNCREPGRFCDAELGITTEAELSDKLKLYFCSGCMTEGLKNNGWAFLKRSWCVPGVKACTLHGTKMLNSEDDTCNCFTPTSKQWFQNFILGYCSKCAGTMWSRQTEKASNLDLAFADCIENALKITKGSFNFSDDFYESLIMRISKSRYLNNLYGLVRKMVQNDVLRLRVRDWGIMDGKAAKIGSQDHFDGDYNAFDDKSLPEVKTFHWGDCPELDRVHSMSSEEIEFVKKYEDRADILLGIGGLPITGVGG